MVQFLLVLGRINRLLLHISEKEWIKLWQPEMGIGSSEKH